MKFENFWNGKFTGKHDFFKEISKHSSHEMTHIEKFIYKSLFKIVKKCFHNKRSQKYISLKHHMERRHLDLVELDIHYLLDYNGKLNPSKSAAT